MRKNEKITALYERLSRDDFGKDDDQQRESNSISNQKAMLEEFAARQGFTNIVHFTDDGISGTCFDRPGFLAMMKEVEAGNVEYLCMPILCASSGVVSPTAKDCIKCRPKCVPRSPAASRVHANSISAVSSPQPKEDASSFPSVFSGFKI